MILEGGIRIHSFYNQLVKLVKGIRLKINKV